MKLLQCTDNMDGALNLTVGRFYKGTCDEFWVKVRNDEGYELWFQAKRFKPATRFQRVDAGPRTL